MLLVYKRIAVGLKARPADFPDYRFQDGQLYRHSMHELDFREVPTDEQWKKCVPTHERSAVLERMHDDPADTWASSRQ